MRLFIWTLVFFIGCAVSGKINEVDFQQFAAKNLFSNGGFEYGKAKWSSSGSPTTYSNQSTTIGSGAYSLQYDADSDTAYLYTDTITVPNGLKKRNGVACVKYRGDGDNYSLRVYNISGPDLVASETLTETGSDWSESCINFIFPDENITIRLYSEAASTDPIYVDDFFVGDAYRVNIKDVNNAEFYGSVRWPGTASCNWQESTSGSWESFSVDGNCTLPTGSNIQGNAVQPDSKIPSIKFSKYPPGRYVIKATGFFRALVNAGTVAEAYFRFHDGTTASDNSNIVRLLASSSANDTAANFIYGEFNNTTAQTDVTIEIQYRLDTGDNVFLLTSDNVQRDLVISVYRFPLSSEVAHKANTTPLLWSGYHDDDCSFSRTNAAYGDFTDDGTCNFGERVNRNFGTVTSSTAKKPGIVFNAPKTGVYKVCAHASISGAANQELGLRLYDKTNSVWIAGTTDRSNSTGGARHPVTICGLVEVNSIGSHEYILQGKAASGAVTLTPASGGTAAVEWTIMDVSQNIPMPQIMNNVETTEVGGLTTEYGNINCDGSSGIGSELGDWILSVGNISSGDCTVTFETGTFSDTPICTPTPYSTAPNFIVGVSNASASSVNVTCYIPHAAANCTSFDANLTCTGPK